MAVLQHSFSVALSKRTNHSVLAAAVALYRFWAERYGLRSVFLTLTYLLLSAELFKSMMTGDFAEFLTLPAYERLD